MSGWLPGLADPGLAPTVAVAFDTAVRRFPERTAVVEAGRATSYAQLAARVDERAATLPAEVAGRVVGVCLRPGPEQIATALAVFRRRAIYLPIDPDYPPARIASTAAGAGAGYVCVDGPSGVTVREVADAVMSFDAVMSTVDGVDPADPGQLAYVVSTSGSTGTPKAVGVTHGGLLNLLSWTAAEYRLAPADRLLPTHAPAFDAAVRELLLPLLTGAGLVVGDGRERFRPQALLDLAAATGVTLLDVVPSLLGHLLSVPDAGERLRRVRVITCGGEALPGALVARLAAVAPWVTLFNQYGPTEATIAATSWCAPAGQTVDRGTGWQPPIGRPVRGVTAYVLDERLVAVPDGTAGELFIGGAGVARGYLGRPELTAERFLPDQYLGGGARMYRTGDRVVRRAGGDLVFVGRVDDQVKIAGHRVEPGEVAAALRDHPAVADAAVVPVDARSGRRVLAAYVVPAGDRPSSAAVRAWLADRLPWFMVPSYLVVLDRLPLTGTGKLDRAALPVPGAWADPTDEEAGEDPHHHAYRTHLRRVVHEVACAALGVDSVDHHTDLFAIGADSLTVFRIAAAVGDRLGVDLPPGTAFAHRTVAGLAAVIPARDSAAPGPVPDGPAPEPVPDDAASGPWPLSGGQERLWFLDQLAPGSAAYHVVAAYRVGGRLDTGRLTAALRAVCQRHEVLRSRVVSGAAGLRAELLPAVDVVGELVAAPPPGDDLDAALRGFATAPFDLSTGPVLRAALWCAPGGPAGPAGCDGQAGHSHVLAIAVHHIAFDGLSVAPFQRSLVAAYRTAGAATGTPDAFYRLAEAARARLTAARLAGLDRFWRAELAGLDLTLELPADRPHPPVPTYRAAAVPVSLPPGTAAALRELARAGGATLYMATLAVFQALVAQLTGRDEFVVGVPIAGRDRVPVDAVGFFVNTVPIRAQVSGAGSFTELVARVRRTALAAFDHQEMPFDRLASLVGADRQLNRNPVVQVWFDLFTRPPMEDLEPGVTTVEWYETPPLATRFDLELHLADAPDGGLRGELVYASDLFDAATAAQYADQYVWLAERCATAPGRAPAAWEPLSGPLRDTVLRAWNDTAVDTAVDVAGAPTLSRLFEAAAERSPDAVAVYDGEAAVTFRALDARANRLAHHLAGRVPPGNVVAFALPPGLDAVTCLLAVVKARCAYLAIDVDAPPDRVGYMLDNAAATLVLTNDEGAAALSRTDRPVLRLADTAAGPRAASDRAPRETGAPDDLLYVMYTSGSTGLPKAVAMTHRPLLNLLAWQARRVRYTGATAQFSALNFDISVQEMFSTWQAGLPVVLLDRDQRRDPEQMLRLMIRRGVSTLFCPPHVLDQLARAAAEAGEAPPLDYVATAGDALQLTAPIRDLLGRLDGVRLDNQYGPTEAHVVTAELLTGEPAGWPQFPLVGAPVANTAIYLLDPYGRPVPPRVPGEVYVGGVGLARGYLGRTDLTAERFVPDPFGTTPGSRLYRTGDLARWTCDGRIEFLGRTDHQVKIRGYRIEPGEIEAVLMAAAEVADVAVVPDGAGTERRLVAYIVAAAGAPAVPALADRLRAHLRARLPSYMIPAAFVTVPALPLTAAGKLDRKALAAVPVEEAPAEVVNFPTNPQEHAIAGMWSTHLGIAPIDIDADFFELGGHSLLAARTLQDIRGAFKVALPVRVIFEHRTVRALARAVEAALIAEIEAMPDEAIVAALRQPAPVPADFEEKHDANH